MDIGVYPPHINALPSIQLQRLKSIVRWLEKETYFYHNKLQESKIDPSDIRTLNDIKKLPFTTKNEVKT